MNTIKLLNKDRYSRRGLYQIEKKKANSTFFKRSFKSIVSSIDHDSVHLCLLHYLSNGFYKDITKPTYVKVSLICKLTGRPRAVVKKYGLSRTSFKLAVQSGFLSGVFRASW